MQVSHETAILVVASDAPDQLLASILSTPQLAKTPLGPCNLTWAHSFDEGIAQLSGRPFEACIVDSGLGPGAIGFLRTVRTQGWRRPLILCTSVGEHDMQASAQAAGASDVIPKASVSVSALGRVIQAAIQRSRFDETLRFGEEMVRILVEGTRDYAIYMLDREGRVLTWNQGAERIKGYSAHEVLGHHFSMFFTEEDRAALKAAAILRQAVSHGRCEEEALRVRKDGSQFWAHEVVTPLYGQDGQLRGFSKVSRDITAQKAVEEQKLLEGARLSEAFHSSPAGSSIVAMDGTFIDVNDAFGRIFGYGRDELIGHAAAEFPSMWPSPEYREHLVQLLQKEGSYRDIEMVVQDRKGSPRRVRVSAATMDVGGQPCVVAITEDITTAWFFNEQVIRKEARLREAEGIAGMASWEWDVAGRRVTWSPNMYSLLGLDAKGAAAGLGSYLALVHADDRAGVESAMRAVRANPASFEHEHRIVRPDGVTVWMRARGIVLGGRDGQPSRMVGTVQDITAWRQPSSAGPAELQVEETARETSTSSPVEGWRDSDAGAGAAIDPSATRPVPRPASNTWQEGPKLILVKGGKEGSIFPLLAAQHAWLIGRGRDVDVSLVHDPYVSRHGAELRRDGDCYSIQDLAPTKNGTYVNWRRLEAQAAATLRDGDIVGIGRSILVFRAM